MSAIQTQTAPAAPASAAADPPGELPLATTWQRPVPDPALPPGIPVPAHVSALAGRRGTPARPARLTASRTAPAR